MGFLVDHCSLRSSAWMKAEAEAEAKALASSVVSEVELGHLVQEESVVVGSYPSVCRRVPEEESGKIELLNWMLVVAAAQEVVLLSEVVVESMRENVSSVGHSAVTETDFETNTPRPHLHCDHVAQDVSASETGMDCTTWIGCSLSRCISASFWGSWSGWNSCFLLGSCVPALRSSSASSSRKMPGTSRNMHLRRLPRL